MNLLSYVDKYGSYSFEEVPFNEVDNAVLSSMSYLDLKALVSGNRNYPVKIKTVGDLFFENYTKDKKNILSVKNAIKLFREMKDTKRYGDLLLYNYVYEEGAEEQFSALTIEIHSKLVYVSFEGTDHLISGWKEDFMFSYMFPTKSQKKAIDYVNKRFFLQNKQIILGGHSKGGNLAMVAGMYANFLVRDKIIMIYNNDGPGLLRKQFESKYYKRIEEKLVLIVPNYSLVGVLLHHPKNYISVRASRKGFWAHDLSNWVVEDDHFMRAEMDLFSKTLEKEVLKWLKCYDLEQRKKFVFAMFDIFERANVKSLIDIMENKKLILQLIVEYKGVDDENRNILKDFLKMILRCFKEAKIEELVSVIEKNRKS